jgi:large subunit ribosomal protein L25
MAEVRLEVSRRAATTKGETHQLRSQGRIPAIVYGKHIAPFPISVDRKMFVKALEQSGSNTLFSLALEGEPKEIVTLAINLQREPVYRTIQHIDFHAISLEEVITAYISLRLEGTPRGLQEGGVMQENLHRVEVECLPMDIPSHLTIDVSDLTIGDSLFASSLIIPDKVKLLTDPGTAIITIVPPEKVEEAEAAPVTAETAEATKPTEEGAREE